MQLHQLKRREFITLIGGAAVAWPLAARAQQAGKVPTIGLLGAAAATAWSPFVANFVRRLGELGWVEGRTVAIYLLSSLEQFRLLFGGQADAAAIAVRTIQSGASRQGYTQHSQHKIARVFHRHAGVPCRCQKATLKSFSTLGRSKPQFHRPRS